MSGAGAGLSAANVTGANPSSAAARQRNFMGNATMFVKSLPIDNPPGSFVLRKHPVGVHASACSRPKQPKG